MGPRVFAQHTVADFLFCWGSIGVIGLFHISFGFLTALLKSVFQGLVGLDWIR